MSTELNTIEVASRLGISVERVRLLCRKGVLDARKAGGAWLVSKKSVSQYALKAGHKIAGGNFVYTSSKEPGTKPIALSFFSGAMGLDLGIEKAGFEIRLACEVDRYCRQTIALNKPEIPLIGDINDHSAEEVRKSAGLKQTDDIDLVIGGPPCQAFSTAGRRKGFNDGRGNVFLKFLDLALELRPKYIVIENVRGLLSCPMEHRPHDQRGPGFPELSYDELRGGALNFIISRLESAGYGYSFNLYNAANFGTPQVRERVIIVCSRNGEEPPYLVPTHSESGERGLPQWRTLRSCIQDIEEHHHLDFPIRRLRYYKMLKPGQNWRDLPVEIQREAMGRSFYSSGGRTGFFRRLAWDKPSPTLVTHPAMPATDLAHPIENRPLSIEEYKRIQEFPDAWKLAGSLVEQYKQVGNAVPISLGLATGKLVLALLESKEVERYDGFQYSRYKNTSHTEWKVNFEKEVRVYKEKLSQEEIVFS